MNNSREFQTLYQTIKNSAEHSRSVIEILLAETREDGNEYKTFKRTFTPAATLQMLGVSQRQLSDAMQAMDMEPVKVHGRSEYTIDQIYQLRQHLQLFNAVKTLPIVSVMSGKGGVSKTTFTVHLAHQLVLRGKRVLLIDTDPQASATSLLLAVNPDIAFEPDDTIAPFMMGQDTDLMSKSIATGMSGLDIIPCCQGASIMDLQGITADAESQADVADRFWVLRETLAGFKDQYDVLIIDTPPTVTFSNIRCAIASNLIISPIAPSMTDICSSTGYENTLHDYLGSLLEIAPGRSLDILQRRFLISQYDHRLQSHRNFAELIRKTYPTTYATPFANLAEISNTNENGNTIYEERSAINSSSTRKKALDMLEHLFTEVFADIDALARVGQGKTTEKHLEVNHG